MPRQCYKDLIPGKEYTVKGTLMVKSTGEPLLGEDGKPVTAETTFTPDHDHGTVDVTFEFDGSSLKGDIVNEVVVQSGYYEQVLVKEAWDETVQTGSVCASCGEEKPLEGGAA